MVSPATRDNRILRKGKCSTVGTFLRPVCRVGMDGRSAEIFVNILGIQ